MASLFNNEVLKASIDKHFGEIEDPRVERTRAHYLVDIIVIALFATISGADSWVGIETYGNSKEEWLRQFLELPNGIPSHNTCARVFARLDSEQLEAEFRNWVGTIAGKLSAQVIAIDGKASRGSYDREKGIKDLQLVSAWATSSRLVLGQEAVETKSNEITAIPQLLAQLELKGCIVTIDAMGTQKKIAQQICQAKADYILALKGNQGRLFKAVKTWFEKQRESAKEWRETGWHQTEKGHQRLETRTIWQIPASHVLPQELREPWQQLRTIVIVEGTRQLWHKTTHEIRFFISSIEATNQEFASHIRNHWGIENQLHWCLDVVFGEDNSRIRQGHSARNMSLMRRFTLNLLRQETSQTSLTMKRYKAAMDNGFLLKILADSGFILDA
ncbi:transposase [Picosynechococcus sp. PCC 7003]|uniref:ISAs1 family transposase n=1 Tax=Picosynechococcus sp. PCC 7003 TaxID=374981 RepID=UPI000810A6A5|nr:ISAs1 family transposase [Picosynechococcus sp. PCC 7003]ANV85362.1 transposase [Picosynechococcus sp. PCC 7003]